jgi:hypothetical protein
MGKRIILGIGIGVLLTIFVFYSLSVFYPEPERDDYVTITRMQVKNAPEAKRATLAAQRDTQQASYDKVREPWSRNMFLICVAIGLVTLIIGVRLKVQPVSGALMGGGILTLIGGAGSYWDHLGEIIRLVVIGLVLVFLIWLGYKKLGVRVK